VRVILSWVAPGSRNEAVLLVRSVTDLFLEPIRSFLPRTGAIDFSPMVAFLIISLLQSFVTRMMW
jgi:YggT family protein